MAVCITSRTVACAIAALGCAALSGTASADPLEDAMNGFLRDARSSFARMVPLDFVTTMPSLQPPAIQQPAPLPPSAAPAIPQLAPPVRATKPLPPQAIAKPPRQRPPLSPAAAALAAAEAAEKITDANLDAALAANQKALSDRHAADAFAKNNPTPATIAAAQAAADAAQEADANLTDALLADREADARLKAAREAVAAEQNGRKSATKMQATTPVTLADK